MLGTRGVAMNEVVGKELPKDLYPYCVVSAVKDICSLNICREPTRARPRAQCSSSRGIPMPVFMERDH